MDILSLKAPAAPSANGPFLAESAAKAPFRSTLAAQKPQAPPGPEPPPHKVTGGEGAKTEPIARSQNPDYSPVAKDPETGIEGPSHSDVDRSRVPLGGTPEPATAALLMISFMGPIQIPKMPEAPMAETAVAAEAIPELPGLEEAPSTAKEGADVCFAFDPNNGARPLDGIRRIGPLPMPAEGLPSASNVARSETKNPVHPPASDPEVIGVEVDFGPAPNDGARPINHAVVKALEGNQHPPAAADDARDPQHADLPVPPIEEAAASAQESPGVANDTAKTNQNGARTEGPNPTAPGIPASAPTDGERPRIVKSEPAAAPPPQGDDAAVSSANDGARPQTNGDRSQSDGDRVAGKLADRLLRRVSGMKDDAVFDAFITRGEGDGPRTVEPVSSAQVAYPAASTPLAETARASKAESRLSVSQTDSVVRQVLDRVEALAASRSSRNVTIHLDPRDFGSITLVVKQQGRSVDAEIYASDEAVRQTLQAHRPQLTTGLEARGILLGSMTVGNELPNHSGRQEQAMREMASRQMTTSAQSDSAAATTLTLDSVRRLSRSATGVDLWT